jgi:hypothetical protein
MKSGSLCSNRLLLCAQYNSFEVTKLYLSTVVLGDWMTQIKQNGDSSVNDMHQQMVAPLETLITHVNDAVVTTYTKLLSFLTELHDFTGNSSIEALARSMKIWRKPVPNLELPKVIKSDVMAKVVFGGAMRRHEVS